VGKGSERGVIVTGADCIVLMKTFPSGIPTGKNTAVFLFVCFFILHTAALRPWHIRPLDQTKTKTKTIGPNPGLDSAPSSWDHPRSTPVPALPAYRSPTSTSTNYILALRPHARLVLHAHSSILVSRPTVISIFLQIRVAPPVRRASGVFPEAPCL
jgi:hypothetical protein